MSADLYALRRRRMVQEQLASRDIYDERVLAAMREVPRHCFVGEELLVKAYGDYPLPIGAGQTISQPYIVAVMTQALQLKGDEIVLEVGTGSGYQTAVLSRLCHQVYSVERINALLVRARQTFSSLHYYNIRSHLSDGTLGWSQSGPYDAIIVTAGGPEIPQPLVDQLKDGGRMVIPVGSQQEQELKLVEKREEGLVVTSLSPVKFVDLVGEHGWSK